MDLGVRAQESSLTSVFATGEQLCMPPYQRSYSWTTVEARDLLDDIRQAAETGHPHFIGAVVLVRSDTDNKLEIVDGQQRLTTLTILLAVLRDLETDPEQADAMHALLGDGERPVLGEPASWRLTLNDMDGHFFRETVQARGATLTQDAEPGESESQQRMSENVAVFHSDLQAISIEQRRAIANIVMNGCAMVRVVVADRDSGFRVFRVLNTRGKAPNAHDIIKTELFERAKLTVDEAKDYAEQWTAHEALLGGQVFDKLLGHIRAIYDKNGKGDLLAGFKRSIFSKMSARDFLDKLLPDYVAAYKEIHDGDVALGDHSAAVSQYLTRLRALEHKGWRAPALKFIVEHRKNAARAPEFFAKLERLGYVIQLAIDNKDQRAKRYRKVIDAVGNDRVLFGRTSPFNITRDEGRRVRERLRGRFGSFGQRRSMALRLNAAIEGGRTLTPESDATVEHVLPRKIPDDSYWLTIWPDHQKRRELCDTLGNFVLLPQKVNQKADRMDFRAKKTIYFAGEREVFALTKDLEHQETWTADVVRKRTDQLAEILIAAWEIP